MIGHRKVDLILQPTLHLQRAACRRCVGFSQTGDQEHGSERLVGNHLLFRCLTHGVEDLIVCLDVIQLRLQE